MLIDIVNDMYDYFSEFFFVFSYFCFVGILFIIIGKVLAFLLFWPSCCGDERFGLVVERRKKKMEERGR